MTEYNAQGAVLGNAARVSNEALSSLEKKQTSYDTFVGSVSRRSVKAVGLDGVEVDQVSWVEDSSIQSSDQVRDAISAMDDRVQDIKLKASYGSLPVAGMDETPGSNFYMASPQNINIHSVYESVFGTDYDKLKDT